MLHTLQPETHKFPRNEEELDYQFLPVEYLLITSQREWKHKDTCPATMWRIEL